jgi:hypothetical protein
MTSATPSALEPYLVTSDIISGVIALISDQVDSPGKMKYDMKALIPFVSNVVFSVTARMFQNSWNKDNTGYINSAQGRGALIVAVSAAVASFMLAKNHKATFTLNAVGADVLADSIVGSLFATDTILFGRQ